ncbi:MAG: hypothetical protein ACHQ6U_06640 [Thermodesulfobacteriota bacterium]
MLENDIALLCFLFLIQIIVFFLLHIVILRVFAAKNILYTSAFTAVLSVAIVTLSSYFLVSDWFSTIESYALSVTGSGISAIFACGLYTFLGPVTADRSLASQMLVFIFNKAGTECRREELYHRFDAAGFIEKRINECTKENVAEDLNETVVLTERGKRLAKVYIFLLRTLGLRERNDYKEYFPNG